MTPWTVLPPGDSKKQQHSYDIKSFPTNILREIVTPCAIAPKRSTDYQAPEESC